MKPKHLLIALLLFFTSCNWAEWFEAPNEPYQYLYVPDSLRLPYKTGDTIIFRSITNDTVMYDTFRIEKKTVLDTFYESNTPYPIGEYDRNYLRYINKNKMIKLLETYRIYSSSLFADITTYYDYDTIGCDIWNYTNFYKTIVINNITYKSVRYSDSYYNCICIYVNTYDGLIRYITLTNDVFDIYEYKPIAK